MSKSVMSIDEKRWQRESDARTLAMAEAIKMDKSRMAGAKIAAKEQLKNINKEAKGLAKIAKVKTK